MIQSVCVVRLCGYDTQHGCAWNVSFRHTDQVALSWALKVFVCKFQTYVFFFFLVLFCFVFVFSFCFCFCLCFCLFVFFFWLFCLVLFCFLFFCFVFVFFLTFKILFEQNYLSLIMPIYWMINVISPICSHAIQKILMVWVCIIFIFRSHVIRTQTINIFTYCMNKRR